MKDYQSKFLLLMHSFYNIKFWKLVPELNPSEHMLIFALCRCESGKCGEFTDDININPSEVNGVKVSSLAKAGRMPMPGVSRVLAGLEDKGIIVRKIDPRDRRNTLVFLTEDGYKNIKEYKNRIDCYFDTVFNRFGEERANEFIELIAELADIAQEELQNALKGGMKEKSDKTDSVDEGADLHEEGDGK